MKSPNVESQPGSMVGWLDRVQMSKPDRKIAEAYLRKTEALFDLLWFFSARIRAVFVRADRMPVGTGLSGQVQNATHRA